VENYRSPLVIDLVKAGVHEQVLEKGLAKGGVVSEQQMIMQVLSGGRPEEDGDVKAAAGGFLREKESLSSWADSSRASPADHLLHLYPTCQRSRPEAIRLRTA
jgi:protein JSN1